MEYTKGEWKADASMFMKGLVVRSGNKLVAVTIVEDEINKEEAAANAKLIANAPNMLETLEHIVEYWNRDQNEKAIADALWHIIDVAEEAIAKATGREVVEE